MTCEMALKLRERQYGIELWECARPWGYKCSNPSCPLFNRKTNASSFRDFEITGDMMVIIQAKGECR